ncbi:MAG: N-acetylglucosamine-6-phosphate deacetylase [Clostridia bacterium]|nr:N-acetylglucosamine-6-phosphate deacetylase [Clostridia bacterium]
MKTLIQNGKVVLPDCSGVRATDVLIENGLIMALGNDLEAENVFDADGKYILPGLIDIHCHGALGALFGFDVDHKKMLRFFAERGTTTVLPTFSTQTLEILAERMKRVLGYKGMCDDVARIGGFHLEGPFISKEKKGAMAIQSPPCDLESFRRLIDAGEGEIKIMAIAPERENALDVIREGVGCGVRMALGHTMATYSEAMAAIEAGANHATHTFNAMRGYNHREPGVLGAVLTEPTVTCEAICDLVHLAPATVKLIRLAKGVDKMILISDAVGITGMPNGAYEFDGQTRVVKDGISRTLDGTIAGSCFTMAEGAKKLIKLGFSPADVARVGSLNPAKVAKLDSELGSIEVGKFADLLICDQEMNIERVMLGGRFLL